MKFTSEMIITGMKGSKGTLDDGTVFDSTKVYTLVDMDASKGNAAGQAGAEYPFGTAAEFEKFKHLPFPFKAQVDVELQTNGKTSKTVITGVRPIDNKSPTKVQ
jgi:hypothetical protein